VQKASGRVEDVRAGTGGDHQDRARY
jgi:hypothetical protein